MDVRSFLDEFRKNRRVELVLPLFKQNVPLCESLLTQVEKMAEYPYSEYASWLWLDITKDAPSFSQAYYPRLVDILFKTTNQTVLRNVLSTISQLQLEDYRESEFVNLLFSFLLNKSNKVALHVHSIYVLLKFTKKYPDLRNELKYAVGLLMENASPALKVAARKIN